MRKRKYISILALMLPFILKAQIPNPDFENWKAITRTFPSIWKTYGTTTKVQGAKGSWAVKLQMDPQYQNGPGAVIYGNPERNFAGGVPCNGRPDSAVGYFKTHLVSGDTAWFLVFLKRKGILISQDIFNLTGTDTLAFKRLAFKINYMDTGFADSVVVGVSSTNPDKAVPASFVIADSLQLVGGTTTINLPNAGFELWGTESYDELDGWMTTNSQTASGMGKPVIKTTDKVFSNYAARIENVDLGGGQFATGYIMAGRQGQNGPLPGFPVQGKDSLLYVNYKCTPKAKDTITIGIIMFEKGNMVGTGVLNQWANIGSYTQAVIAINYSPSYTGTPDSAAIFCAAFNAGSQPRGNSVLYVDGFKLNTPMNSVSRIGWSLPVAVFPNPASNILNIRYISSVSDNIILSLSDMSGKVVKSVQYENNAPGMRMLDIDVRDLSNGMYTVQMVAQGKIFSSRFMVSH